MQLILVHIYPSNLNRRLKKALVKVDLTPIKFHNLRHTYDATRLFENDIQPKIISNLLVHKDITTTYIYINK